VKLLDNRFFVGYHPFADVPLAWQRFELEPAERASLAAVGPELPERLERDLEAAGISCAIVLRRKPAGEDPRALIAACYAHAALALQRAAGHRVAHADVWLEEGAERAALGFEFETLNAGREAGELALLALRRCWSALDASVEVPAEPEPFDERLRRFVAMARELALPADTAAILAAAARAGIPCLKMDRDPFEPRRGSFRIRPNGLLKLGHCRHQHIVDGTFCVDRSQTLAPLLRERAAVLALLERLGLPLPRRDAEGGSRATRKRALRAAARIGYPVVLRPLLRENDDATPELLRDERELEAAHSRWLASSRRVVLEGAVAGERWRILVANRTPLAVLGDAADGSGRSVDVTARAHPALLAAASGVATAVDAGLFVLTLHSPDVAQAPEDCGGAFVDLEVAPALDRLLAHHPGLLSAAADAFVAWLFPPGAPARVPLIAVTGTNGKTTASRMAAAVLRQAGFATGLACTDGVYVNDRQVASGDLAGIPGHYRLLENAALEAAVLETARGGVLTQGMGYDWIDAAVCVNVTLDHLGQDGIETLGQMAEIKRRVVERARAAAVLNADDPLCLAMLPHLAANRVCLVSLRSAASGLEALGTRADCFAVLETVDAVEWLVIHDAGRRIALLPAAAMPASFGGAARFNLANALHAGAACYLVGIAPRVIRAALEGFRMGCESTPGRLNFFEGLPYRLLLDYAHNPDGVASLCEFTDRVPVQGRRILVFSAPGHNSAAVIAGNARAAAGHFDRYICFNYQRNVANGHDHVPDVLAGTLQECGVAPDAIAIEVLEMDALEAIFRIAAPGDFVVFLSGVGNRAAIWERIAAVTAANRDQSPILTSSLQ